MSFAAVAWAPSQTPLLLLLPGLDPDRHYKVGHMPLPGERQWPQRSASAWTTGGAVLAGDELAEIGLQAPPLPAETAIPIHIQAVRDDT